MHIEDLFVIPGRILTGEISNFTPDRKFPVVRIFAAEDSSFFCNEQIYNAFVRAAGGLQSVPRSLC